MDVPHAVNGDAHHSLDVPEVPHRAHGVTLHHDVALSQQLKCLERLPVWPNKSLSALDEFLFVTDKASDFNHLSEHAVIFDDFDGLLKGDGSGKELDEISGLDDLVWVPALACRTHSHGALKHVELSIDLVRLQSFLDKRKDFLNVAFTVLREQNSEGGLINDTTMGIVLGIEGIFLELVKGGVVVPWLRLAVLLVLVHGLFTLGCYGWSCRHSLAFLYFC